MLQQFILRQAVSVVVSVVVRLIENHKGKFDPSAAKEQAREQIERLVPPSLWGEQWFESQLIAVADWMIDRGFAGMQDGAKVTEKVLTALAEKNLSGALQAVREFFLFLIQGQSSVNDYQHASSEIQDIVFADTVLQAWSEETNQSEEDSDMAEKKKSNDPGVNTLGAQQTQGEPANRSEENDPVQVEEQKKKEEPKEDAGESVVNEESEEQADKILPSHDGK